MDKILDSCQTLNQKVLSYMHLQILATIIILMAILVLQQQLNELKSSEIKSIKILESKEVKLLKDAWSLDSLILNEISNDYRNNMVKNASELAILMTVFLALTSEGQQDNKKFQQTFDEMGRLSRELNLYRQALIGLEKSAIKGTAFNGLDSQLLEHYHSFLRVENGKGNFDKSWTKLCILATVYNKIRKDFIKNGGVPDKSAYKKLYESSRVTQLLNWAEDQLIRQSDKPGDLITILENANLDESSLFADVVLQMTQEGELKEFRTLRQVGANLTYGFTQQISANSDTVVSYKAHLDVVGYENLHNLQINLNSIQRKIKTLQEDEKISLPFIGTSVPISIISWVLPLTNFVIIVLIFQARKKATNLISILNKSNFDTFSMIETRYLDYTKITSADWLWSLHRDSLGCFGLSLVTIYHSILVFKLSAFTMFITCIVIYLILLILNIYLWKYLLNENNLRKAIV